MRKSAIFALVISSITCGATAAQEVRKPFTRVANAPSSAREQARAELKIRLTEAQALQARIKQLRQTAELAPREIAVHVQIMEVSREKLETAGYCIGKGGIVGLLKAGPPTSVPRARVASSRQRSANECNAEGEFAVFDSGSKALNLLNLWQQRAMARVLAEPTLTTVDARPTSFNLGGEIPVIFPTPNGVPTLQYRLWGTEFGVTPAVLDDGAIRLELRPRFRELDHARSIVIHGQQVPAVRVRKVDAAVTIRRGQTLVMNGLTEIKLQDNVSERGRTTTEHPIHQLLLATVEFAVDAGVAPRETADSSE